MQFRSNTQGGAIVEFAVLTPLLIGLFIAYWNLLVTSVLAIRQEVALTQVELDFERTPLKAEVSRVGTQPQLVVSRLDNTEIFSAELPPRSLLAQVNTLIVRAHQFAGTGSEFTSHSVASELWYFSICINKKDACVDKALGDAFKAERGGGEASAFFSFPSQTDCFNAAGGDVVRQSFVSYVRSQVSTVLHSPAERQQIGMEPLPFGTALLDVDTKLNKVGRLLDYLPWRAVLFVAQCSIGPHVGTPVPRLKFSTHFFDKQLSKPVI